MPTGASGTSHCHAQSFCDEQLRPSVWPCAIQSCHGHDTSPRGQRHWTTEQPKEGTARPQLFEWLVAAGSHVVWATLGAPRGQPAKYSTPPTEQLSTFSPGSKTPASTRGCSVNALLSVMLAHCRSSSACRPGHAGNASKNALRKSSFPAGNAILREGSTSSRAQILDPRSPQITDQKAPKKRRRRVSAGSLRVI